MAPAAAEPTAFQPSEVCRDGLVQRSAPATCSAYAVRRAERFERILTALDGVAIHLSERLGDPRARHVQHAQGE